MIVKKLKPMQTETKIVTYVFMKLVSGLDQQLLLHALNVLLVVKIVQL